MSASQILAAWVATHFTGLGARLFRNNVGEAWAGPGHKKPDGSVLVYHASRIKYGLAVGSSDHIGWTPVTTQAGYSEAQIWAAFLSGRDSVDGPLPPGDAMIELLSRPGMVPDFQAQTIAVFTAVEEKTLAYKTLTDDQRNFLDQVTAAGGLAYVARETKDGPLLNRWPEKT